MRKIATPPRLCFVEKKGEKGVHGRPRMCADGIAMREHKCVALRALPAMWKPRPMAQQVSRMMGFSDKSGLRGPVEVA